MNATNPFQIPTCFQTDQERRRRERFKRTFMAVIGASILLLVGLLIEGCVTEHSRAAASTNVATASPAPTSHPLVAMVEPKTVALPPPNPQPAMSQSATVVSKANTPPVGRLATIYVVRSGDNLTRIAKAHGTTVRAIEAANGLATDRIAIGAKLKIPQA